MALCALFSPLGLYRFVLLGRHVQQIVQDSGAALLGVRFAVLILVGIGFHD
ncbi:MAG: hypothetical protein JWR07_5718 [Nevskia sp.]|nr:hypothetical protein [Nevskia sp.]